MCEGGYGSDNIPVIVVKGLTFCVWNNVLSPLCGCGQVYPGDIMWHVHL